MNDDNWYQDSEASDIPSDPNEFAQKRGMSTGMKVFIGIVIAGGIMAVLCCGGLYFLGSKFAKMMTEVPEEIVEIQKSIADIDIPEKLEPRTGMDFSILGVQMKWAVFEGGESVLMLMQMTGPGEMTDEQVEQQFDQARQQQGNQSDLQIESSEDRTFTVSGEEVTFEFVKGTSKGKDFRQVSGLFPGRGGRAWLMYRVPEEDWNEEQVVQMIESIKN